jgi:CBS domain-containing protein
MNQVWQILRAKGTDVWTISQDATVLDALKLLAEKQIGSLVVMHGNKLAGIFSERDFARKVGITGRLPEAVKVYEVMSENVTTVNPRQSVQECMELMTERRIRHLPVIEDGQLVGLVSIGDIVKDIIEELQLMVEQLENYITGLR